MHIVLRLALHLVVAVRAEHGPTHVPDDVSTVGANVNGCATPSGCDPDEDQRPDKGYFESCRWKAECLGASPCVNVATKLAEEPCLGSECLCVPCHSAGWIEHGCPRFETMISTCRGAQLQNVSEVCGDPCKVALPVWVGMHVREGCHGYCRTHGLKCRSAWVEFPNEDEDICDAAAFEHRSCHAPIEEGHICECKGMTLERLERPGPDHELVDLCMALLNEYEWCVYDKPELREHMPDPRIRERLEFERNAQCIDIPQEVFDKHRVVGCSGPR